MDSTSFYLFVAAILTVLLLAVWYYSGQKSKKQQNSVESKGRKAKVGEGSYYDKATGTTYHL